MGTENGRPSKKQVTLFSMACFKGNVAANTPCGISPEDDSLQSAFDEHGKEMANELGRITKAVEKYQDDWAEKNSWLEVDKERALMWCSICKKDPHCKSLFATTGAKNFKTSALDDHASSKAHRDAILLQERDKDGLQKLEKKRKASVESSLVKLFKCAYWIAKEDLAFRKLVSLLSLMRDCGVEDLPFLYNDNKACASFIFYISKSLHASILDRVRRSPWFGIMVDESTDISVTKNLILYATFLEERRVKTVFLGMMAVKDGRAEGITESIVDMLKEGNLDIGKLMGFGSDGANIMVGAHTGVAARLKSLNPFLTSMHCCAHRANLCVQETCKTPTIKTRCKFIDELVNRVASFFSKSSIRKAQLEKMQEAFDTSHLRILGIVKTRWLSRHGAIERMCEVYETLMQTLLENPDGKALYLSLKSFLVVYILHFLADILKIMSNLSLEFQRTYVDINNVPSLCRNAIQEIEELFLVQIIDLNSFQKDSRDYPIIPDYGGEGMLHVLRASVKGNMYRSIELDRQIDGEDLSLAIEFQKAFATALIGTLKKRLEDQIILSSLKVLCPINMPSRAKELKVYGIDELKKLRDFYGVQRNVDGKIFPAVIDIEKLGREYALFKRQASIEWQGRSFLDTWGMISCSDLWKEKMPELLSLATIGLVQCTSTSACERGFSRMNIVKTKYRNRLQNDGLDALLRISMEGPELKDFDFSESIELWKESAHYRHIFTGCPREEQTRLEKDRLMEDAFMIDLEDDD